MSIREILNIHLDRIEEIRQLQILQRPQLQLAAIQHLEHEQLSANSPAHTGRYQNPSKSIHLNQVLPICQDKDANQYTTITASNDAPSATSTAYKASEKAGDPS